jgi:hypothetical protein
MPASIPSEPATEVREPAAAEAGAPDEPAPVEWPAAEASPAPEEAAAAPPEAAAHEPEAPVLEPEAPVLPVEPVPAAAVPAPPPPPFDAPAATNGSSENTSGLADQRPEIFVGAAFAGGFLAAQILKRLGRR